MKNLTSVLAISLMVFVVSSAEARKPFQLINPNPDALTIINSMSDVDGHVAGFVDGDGNINGDPYNPNNVSILYALSGKVYATITESVNGTTVGAINETGTVNATASFSTSFFGLLSPDWSMLPATLDWTMIEETITMSGSTFVFDQDESLQGRAFPGLGPVDDPSLIGAAALRMAGCAGVREISGQGNYANKVGTMCLNGTFLFQPDFSGKGVSNCNLVLHDPLYPVN